MSSLTIRLALPADILAIVAINAAGRPGVYPLTPDTTAGTRAATPHVVVAELDDRVVGYMIGYASGDVCEGDEFAWFHARLGFQEVAVIMTYDGRTVSLQRKDLSAWTVACIVPT